MPSSAERSAPGGTASDRAVLPGARPLPQTWAQDPVGALPSLLPFDRVVGAAARGAGDFGAERDRAVSYPARLALRAAAWRPELLAALVRAGVTGARVLDVGCGPGVGATHLLEAGAREVVGVDVDPAMVALGGRLPGQEGMALQVLDAAGALPFEDDAFEVVRLGDWWSAAALPELRRVLRPGGRLVRQTTAPWGQTYAHDPGLELRAALAAHQGLSRWRERTRAATPGQDAAPSGPAWQRGWRRVDAWTSVVERRHPVPEVDAADRRQDFGLFTGTFVADHACADDWRVLARLWHPGGEGDLLRRRDVDLVRALHHEVWTPEEAP